jgi:RNA polymerase sigma-70 factor, ECF subfamily
MLAAIPKLRAFAIFLCRDRNEADDLVQATLLRACAHIDSFEPGTNMDAWLFVILRNHFYSQYQRRRNLRAAIDQLAKGDATLPQQVASLEYSEVCAAVARLEPEQRDALMLVAVSGFSYDEAADLCGCCVGTIKSRVCRARTKLADMLAFDAQDYFEADGVFSAVVANPGMPMQS